MEIVIYIAFFMEIGSNLTQNKQDCKQGMMNAATPDCVDGSSSSKAASDSTLERKVFYINYILI